MAKARKLPINPPPPSIQLDLTADEAAVLLEMIWHTGGAPKGPRSCADEIRSALLAEGVRRIAGMSPTGTGIYLPDEWPT